ncbi:c48e2693-8d8c-45b3-a7b4-c0ba2d284aea-CDS [Sclerotinia trifoliorum]|uniref:C48e2693-8d8c-45b3-a7b4-c0ba2d284aea-CDS n=1 Tax=Sclerotinia trifoliorum TaxID=28548 RepID=A0A8H2VSZ1_9HELO|nr:c48e2693-8d8c-45b3-a7b4-c0ba2d284aea-CDS [Sclerotinia trifoliorum]
MEAKISHLQKTLRQKDEVIKRAQEELIKKYTSRETWVPMDNIADIFQYLRYAIRQWCSAQAKKDYKFDLKGNEWEQEFPKALLRDGNLRTRVILEGLFAHHLFSAFFPDPFFFLG